MKRPSGWAFRLTDRVPAGAGLAVGGVPPEMPPFKESVLDDDNVDMFSDLDGDAGGDDSGSTTGGDDAASAPPKDESKRINDLMSRAQKAEARADKAEKALEASAAKDQGQRSEGQAPAKDGDADPTREEWISAQREFLRERALNSDARFEEYGIGLDDLTGDTPAEIKASVKRFQTLIDAVETKARTRLLQEYGLNPEIAGQAMDPKVDIDGMSESDFNKLVDKARGWR